MVRAFIKLNKQLKSLKQKQSCTKVYDFLKFSMTIFSKKKTKDRIRFGVVNLDPANKSDPCGSGSENLNGFKQQTSPNIVPEPLLLVPDGVEESLVPVETLGLDLLLDDGVEVRVLHKKKKTDISVQSLGGTTNQES